MTILKDIDADATKWLELLAAVGGSNERPQRHARMLLAERTALREALTLALSCELDDWRMWHSEARRALGLPVIEDPTIGDHVPHDRRDIVERLRSCTFGDRVLAYEAAAEIERLRSPAPAEAIEALPPPDYVLGWRRGLEEAAKECIRLATDCAMHGDPNDCDVCKLAADRIRSLSPPAGDAG